MPVVKLRTRRHETALARVRDAILEIEPELPLGIAERLVCLVDKELAPRRGWRFVMSEPDLNTYVVDRLALTSKRPIKAMRLWAHLIRALDRYSNEVKASREDLAKALGIAPTSVSEIMGELEEIGAIYKRRDGRFVRYYVNENVATHLAGDARDKAQAEAPPLRLVEPA